MNFIATVLLCVLLSYNVAAQNSEHTKNQCSSINWLGLFMAPNPINVIESRNFQYSLMILDSMIKSASLPNLIFEPQTLVDGFSRSSPNCSLMTCASHRIPAYYHGVWITDPKSPRQVSSQISNFAFQGSKLHGFELVIWGNIPSEKFWSINPALKEIHGLKYKDLKTLSTSHKHLLEFLLSDDPFISQNRGFAIDLAKYLIMESEGGVLADLNFEFSEKFDESILKDYDFLALSAGWLRLENSFFIAKAHHPIFVKTLDIIDKVIFSDDCVLSTLKKEGGFFQVVEFFSMHPLTIAYGLKANIDNNVDVPIAYCSTSPRKLPSKDLLHRIEELNTHSHDSINWLDDSTSTLAMQIFKILKEIKESVKSQCVDKSLVGEDRMGASWW